MAGTINLILTQQVDKDSGLVLSGGQLFFYQAGTTTPTSAYYDYALTSPLPNPFTLDATGRIPQFFLPDGQIKIRLVNSIGVEQFNADNLLVIGPSSSGSGGGGGGSVDPTTVNNTGYLIWVYGDGQRTGFVRPNGYTIGSSNSGASERANADTLALYTYLYNVNVSLPVSGGRGTSALSDFNANKTLTLPDLRGRVFIAPDGMGNARAQVMRDDFFGSNADQFSSIGGFSAIQLTTAQIPSHTHSGTTGVEDQSHSHGNNPQFGASSSSPNVGSQIVTSTSAYDQNKSGIVRLNLGTEDAQHKHPFTTDSGTGGNAYHSNVQPGIVLTPYMKL